MENNPYAPPTSVVADPPAAVAPARPVAGTLAVRLMVGSLLVGMAGRLHDMFSGALQPGISRTQQFAIDLILSLLTLGLMAWVIRAIGQGRNWARVLITVITALNVFVIILLVLTVPFEPLQEIFRRVGISWYIYLPQMALDLAAIVQLFKSESNAWYAACREARRVASDR